LTKQQRIAAYRIVAAQLNRGFTATQVNTHANIDDFTLAQKAQIIDRANYILENLREDAKDLWDES